MFAPNQVCQERIPEHVAIIMDGNRRWAKRQPTKVARIFDGHWRGAEVLTEIVDCAKAMGIKTLTVFGFSTENWKRSGKEVQTVLQIAETYLKENAQKMQRESIRFDVIGDLMPLPVSLREEVKKTQQMTELGKEFNLVLALNYGGRDEIRRACQRLLREEIDPEKITEEMVASHLDTARFSDPDLLIRTSGEMRVSNFLLWQIAYSEVYVTETLWPDFSGQDLLKAVLQFQKRKRRMGR